MPRLYYARIYPREIDLAEMLELWVICPEHMHNFTALIDDLAARCHSNAFNHCSSL